MNYIYILIGAGLFLLYSCQQKKHSEAKSNIKIDSAIVQNATTSPNNLNNTDQKVIQFWENFNFQNDSLAVSPQYGEQHLVNFINLFPSVQEESITAGLQSLFKKSASKPHIQKYFEGLLNRYLYDVNSPFYNELYYIIVLETIVNSDALPQDSKIKHKILLKIANQNKVGTKAANFSFLANGREQNLYDIQSDYIILFFYEPSCNSCKESIHILRNSLEFESILRSKAIILAIYPDGNKEIWEENALNIPSSWTNGIDINKKILTKGLYDLKASPTIYLIDKNKNVILKDTNLNHLLEYFKTG